MIIKFIKSIKFRKLYSSFLFNMLRTLEIKVNRFMVKELPQIILTSYLLHWINVFPCD